MTSWDSGYGPIIIPAIDEVVLLSNFEKFKEVFVNLKKKANSLRFKHFTLELVTLSGGCGWTRSDGRRWETNYKDSETQSASFAAT